MEKDLLDACRVIINQKYSLFRNNILNDKYYIGLDKGKFHPYKILLCGWIPDPQPNSSILDSATDIYNDFLTVANQVADELTVMCEELQNELENKVNHEIEKEGFEFAPFEIIDVCFENIPKFQLEWKHKKTESSVKWTRENLDLFLENARNSILKMVDNTEKQFLKMFGEDLLEQINN